MVLVLLAIVYVGKKWIMTKKFSKEGQQNPSKRLGWKYFSSCRQKNKARPDSLVRKYRVCHILRIGHRIHTAFSCCLTIL